jgi:hypothetical protein
MPLIQIEFLIHVLVFWYDKDYDFPFSQDEINNDSLDAHKYGGRLSADRE